MKQATPIPNNQNQELLAASLIAAGSVALYWAFIQWVRPQFSKPPRKNRRITPLPGTNVYPLSGGSATSAPEIECRLSDPIQDPVDEASYDSFPASDPPAH